MILEMLNDFMFDVQFRSRRDVKMIYQIYIPSNRYKLQMFLKCICKAYIM